MSVSGYPSLAHLAALTDDTGVIQHATCDIPNRATGYCTDDVARGLIVAVDATRRSPTDPVAARLAKIYLSFLHDAQLADGWFHNFMGYDRTWQDRRGSSDAFGRAVWALGHCVRFAPRESWRRLARQLFVAALPHVDSLEHLRSRAYCTLGLVHALHAPMDDTLDIRARLAGAAEPIVEAYERTAEPGWAWCEPALTYDNARLPEALLRAGPALGNAQFTETGLRMFAFYERVVTEDGTFVPVGSNGWYPRGGMRARYGQQPIEAAATVDAALAAGVLTRDPRHAATADRAYRWFFGANSARAILVEGGGCSDGIDPSGASANMGAESTLAYLQAAMVLAKPAAEGLRLVR